MGDRHRAHWSAEDAGLAVQPTSFVRRRGHQSSAPYPRAKRLRDSLQPAAGDRRQLPQLPELAEEQRLEREGVCEARGGKPRLRAVAEEQRLKKITTCTSLSCGFILE